MKSNDLRDRLLLVLSMLIFATIGIARRYLPIPSGMLAMLRGAIGAVVLFSLLFLFGKRMDLRAIRKRFWRLVLGGVLIGLNWIFLFESYRYTTVAVATLCYYTAPVIVLLLSPIVLRERLSRRAVVSILLALVGIVFVSGVLSGDGFGGRDALGVLFGLLAAVLYASVILINKTVTGVSASDRTVVELLSAAVLLLPYTLILEDLSSLEMSLPTLLLILLVGVVHTGIAYALYFGAIGALPASTVSVLSYLDPVGAILLAVVFLDEPLTPSVIVGTVLILGGTLLSELPVRRKKQ